MIRRSILLLSVFAMVAAACTSKVEETASSSPSPSSSATGSSGATASPSAEVLAFPAAAVRFGELTDVPLFGENAPAYAGTATPSSLEGVQVAPSVANLLKDPGVKAALLENGFVVVPSDFRLFHFAYQGNVYEGWPVYVTTDVAYHTWHLVFDKVLRTLEQETLLPELETLVSGLLRAAHTQTQDVAGTQVEDAASRVEQLLQVAAAELDLPVTLGPLAQKEKALVDAHAATEVSPIVGGTIDYSIFTPRGHYTRTPELTRYFVAMSVLGQLAFCLPGTTDCPGLDPARMAILASRLLAADGDLLASWRRIYEPTSFLVGLADDYTPLEVAGAARAVVDSGLGDPAAFGDDAVVSDVVDALVSTRPVRIDPDHASIRLMGARFVLDSFVFDQLISPNVGTADEPRNLPSALDLAAAFGSSFAYDVLDRTGETGYANYDEQLRRMQDAIAARAPQDWGGTVYDAWLHALEPVFIDHGDAYPDYMRTDVWAAKATQAGLGSFAELKHDTILYTKQAVAEGGDEAPIPDRRNWVEPEPSAFGRLAAMAELMRSGLDERDLLAADQSALLRDVGDLFSFFQEVAQDELAGVPLSERANDRLTYGGGAFEGLWYRSSDQTKTGLDADEDAAIVADVASGPDGILEVGTGRIDRILVLVPDDRGTFQVAMGGVYSYYEFTSSPGERLSDEAWRAKLDAGDQPERPAWERALFAG